MPSDAHRTAGGGGGVGSGPRPRRAFTRLRIDTGPPASRRRRAPEVSKKNARSPRRRRLERHDGVAARRAFGTCRRRCRRTRFCAGRPCRGPSVPPRHSHGLHSHGLYGCGVCSYGTLAAAFHASARSRTLCASSSRTLACRTTTSDITDIRHPTSDIRHLTST